MTWKSNFVVSGENEAQLRDRELRFSYTMANPKTAVYNFRSSPEDRRYADTGEFLVLRGFFGTRQADNRLRIQPIDL